MREGGGEADILKSGNVACFFVLFYFIELFIFVNIFMILFCSHYSICNCVYIGDIIDEMSKKNELYK